LERLAIYDGKLDLPGWHDRPREYIWSFVSEANQRAKEKPGYIDSLQAEFEQMLNAVASLFPYGFRKTAQGNQIPRVRFEAIAVGTALALRDDTSIMNPPVQQVDWSEEEDFSEVTTSDAANVKSKLLKRISFVYERVRR
jgi:hypothetical protein